VSAGELLTLLLLALGLAVQPWSVLAGILLVTSEHGVRKELAYVAGWVVALSVVAVATVAVEPAVPSSSTTSTARAWVEIGLGFVLVGWLVWRRRHPVVADGREPTWMARIDTMPAWMAFGLGAFLPTYALVVAAVNELATSGASQSETAVVAALWILVASLGVAAPLAVLVLRRDDAHQTYLRWRNWIIGHHRMVLSVVAAVLAVALILKGLVGVLG
jgi:hypothetical protein